MKRIIRLLALASALLVFASIPMSSYAVIKYDLFFGSNEITEKKSIGTATEKTKYSGDYLIIFKPGYNTSSGSSTGTFSQQPIENNVTSEGLSENEKPARIDIHPETPDWMHEKIQEKIKNKTKVTYNEGDKKIFYVIDNVQGVLVQLEFKLTKVGTYCYVWSPTNPSFDPLESFNPAYPTMVANEFDSKYPLMLDAFGSYVDVDGSGKVHLVYYDIIDGSSGGSYIGGYFWPGDMYYNGVTMLNIDTNPALTYYGLEDTYSTFIHEFQHLINYCQTGGATELWMNEASSMAAEELIYPNSALPSRINQYNNKNSYPNYHNGKSLYSFDNSLGAYGIACLFGQYLRVHTGDYTVFKRIIINIAAGQSTANAIRNAVQGSPLAGMTLDEINISFRAALVAKESTGIYGFKGESAFNAIGKPYITSKTTVYSGGAVVIRPTNGVYTVPSDAGNDLIYVGIKNNKVIHDPESVEITNGDIVIQKDASQALEVEILPENSQQYVVYTSSDSNIAFVSNGVIYGIEVGTATITVKTVNGLTDSIQVIVTGETIYHTVRFIDYDDTILSIQEVEHGKSAVAPPNPFREGYTFIGWSVDFSVIVADLDVYAVYTENYVPTIRVEGFTIYADKHADKVVVFGVAKGEYTTYAEMVQNGMVFASSSKQFTVYEPGVYTVYLFMTDSYEYFLTADIAALSIPNVAINNNIVSLEGDTSNVARIGYALGQYDNLIDMIANGMYFAPRYSFVVKTPGTYTVYILSVDGMEYFVEITVMLDANALLPNAKQQTESDGIGFKPIRNADVPLTAFTPSKINTLSSIRHRL